MSRGVGATGAERVACGAKGVFPTAWKTALLTGVADSSCPELETGASRPGTAALGRPEAWRWDCSSAGGDIRPSSGGTQRQQRQRPPPPQRPGPGPDLPSARGCQWSPQAPPPPPRGAAVGAPLEPPWPPPPLPLPGPAAPGVSALPSPPASGLVRPPPPCPRWRRRRRRQPRRCSPRPPASRSVLLSPSALLSPPAPPPGSEGAPPAPCHSRPATAGGARAPPTQTLSGPIGEEKWLLRPAPHGLSRSDVPVPSPTAPFNQSGESSNGAREVSFPAHPFSPLNGCVSRQS